MTGLEPYPASRQAHPVIVSSTLHQRPSDPTMGHTVRCACPSLSVFCRESHGGRGSHSHQRNGERFTAEHHEGNQPPHCPLPVGVVADDLGHVADRCGFHRSRVPWRPPRRVQPSGLPRIAASRFRSSASTGGAFFCPCGCSHLVRRLLAAS
jgi:hypothetical protein